MATLHKYTLLELAETVSNFATSDNEVVATVVYLINSGKVQLCGNFAGAKIDLALPTHAALGRVRPGLSDCETFKSQRPSSPAEISLGLA